MDQSELSCCLGTREVDKGGAQFKKTTPNQLRRGEKAERRKRSRCVSVAPSLPLPTGIYSSCSPTCFLSRPSLHRSVPVAESAVALSAVYGESTSQFNQVADRHHQGIAGNINKHSTQHMPFSNTAFSFERLNISRAQRCREGTYFRREQKVSGMLEVPCAGRCQKQRKTRNL